MQHTKAKAFCIKKKGEKRKKKNYCRNFLSAKKLVFCFNMTIITVFNYYKIRDIVKTLL